MSNQRLDRLSVQNMDKLLTSLYGSEWYKAINPEVFSASDARYDIPGQLCFAGAEYIRAGKKYNRDKPNTIEEFYTRYNEYIEYLYTLFQAKPFFKTKNGIGLDLFRLFFGIDVYQGKSFDSLNETWLEFLKSKNINERKRQY